MFDKQDVTIHETANETGAEREMNYLWSKSASANSITHLPLLTMGWYSLEMVFFESVGEHKNHVIMLICQLKSLFYLLISPVPS